MSKNLDKFKVKSNITIANALKGIQANSEKILFVVGSRDRLLGSLSDGDIRRWIIEGGSLEETIEKVYNKNPFFVEAGCAVDDVKKLMVDKRLEWIPVVDSFRRLQDILFWEIVFSEGFKKNAERIEIPVAIMAGGRGTRLNPLTNILPKALMPLSDKPIAEVIMDRFGNYGCKDFHLIVNYKSGMIKSYFENSNNPYNINYIIEENPLGTAGGLRFLLGIKEECLFLCNCDTIVDADYSDIYNFHRRNKNDLTIVGCIRNFVIPYGVLETGKNGALLNIKEKPEYNFMVNTGMYIINKSALAQISHNECLDMNELIRRMKKNNLTIGVYPISEEFWKDAGQWQGYNNLRKNADEG